MAPRYFPLLLLCALAGCLPRSSSQLSQSVPVLPAHASGRAAPPARAPGLSSFTLEGSSRSEDEHAGHDHGDEEEEEHSGHDHGEVPPT